MNGPIVFYDGDCGFCNRTVEYVLKYDSSDSILFCPIQSDFSENFFKQLGEPKPDLSTFYFYYNNRLYKKSTAALMLARFFSFPRNMLQAGWIVPRFIRDAGYNFIAKRRHRLAKGECFVPDESQKKRFI